MNSSITLKQLIIFAAVIGAIFLIGTLIMPWQLVKWGTISFIPGQTVTVYGEAKTEQKTQVAVFSAGVNVVNDNKDSAVAEVNSSVDKIIAAVKEFGIPDEDIKTQNISIYQGEEYYTEGGVQRSRQGQWRVNNTVEIKLRDVTRAGEFTDLLSENGANNIYGPNFTVDDTDNVDNALLTDAIADATEKAQTIAKSSNRKLGKILNVSEGGVSGNTYYAMESRMQGGGGGAPVEPGTQTVSKTVTVTFELR
ncbi:SIMPL domain-containing protein [Candidatus Gottesmanbacteria bacterium]|nr:SIMPL domain-containing protein [Candidatus Gottesmanbacteria bacterium]